MDKEVGNELSINMLILKVCSLESRIKALEDAQTLHVVAEVVEPGDIVA